MKKLKYIYVIIRESADYCEFSGEFLEDTSYQEFDKIVYNKKEAFKKCKRNFDCEKEEQFRTVIRGFSYLIYRANYQNKDELESLEEKVENTWFCADNLELIFDGTYEVQKYLKRKAKEEGKFEKW